MPGLILIVVGFVFLWLFVIVPQRRRSRSTLEMQNTVEIGEEIVTAGGLYGEVKGFDGNDLLVEIAPGVVVRVARRAVAGVVEPAEQDELDEAEPESEPSPELEEERPTA
ncbi:MAG: preprotein translocase subunit YajC [Gaiellaceae bacterium]|nr:preprotein translocase subunit YajC [Gaiellaceae bacterium]